LCVFAAVPPIYHSLYKPIWNYSCAVDNRAGGIDHRLAMSAGEKKTPDLGRIGGKAIPIPNRVSRATLI
jgi:hypothetical protein